MEVLKEELSGPEKSNVRHLFVGVGRGRQALWEGRGE